LRKSIQKSLSKGEIIFQKYFFHPLQLLFFQADNLDLQGCKIYPTAAQYTLRTVNFFYYIHTLLQIDGANI
jgi:hypothetical protein